MMKKLAILILLFGGCHTQNPYEKYKKEINNQTDDIIAEASAKALLKGARQGYIDTIMRENARISRDSAELGLKFAKSFRNAVLNNQELSIIEIKERSKIH